MYTFHKIINKLNSFFFHIELWCRGANQLRTAKNEAHLSPNNDELSSAQGFQRAEETVLD